MTIATKDLEKLAKIRALFDSASASEAASARARTAAILRKYGYGPDDLDAVLADPGPQPQPSGSFHGFYDINNPAHMRAWADIDRKRRTERARQERPERDRVVERYGSEEAVIAPCAREILLRKAVRQWSTFRDPPNHRWTRSIGQWAGDYSAMPEEVRVALAAAYPLPGTIEEAWAEYQYWERRNREIGLVLEDTSDIQLDLSASGRRWIVQGLVETGLRARTIADVLIRQRYLVDQAFMMPEVDKAVLRDLEYLADLAAGDTVPKPAVQTGQQRDNGRETENATRETASDRRARVLWYLSNMDEAGLSDREIARRVGVSPQTVGNIRRRHLCQV